MAGRSEERHQRMWVARRGGGREETEGLKEVVKQMTMRNNQTPRMLWLERSWGASGPLFPSENEENEFRKLHGTCSGPHSQGSSKWHSWY